MKRIRTRKHYFQLWLLFKMINKLIENTENTYFILKGKVYNNTKNFMRKSYYFTFLEVNLELKEENISSVTSFALISAQLSIFKNSVFPLLLCETRKSNETNNLFLLDNPKNVLNDFFCEISIKTCKIGKIKEIYLSCNFYYE
ncbi:hypothetical protein EDEG_03989 [Edhazardia aedis USNM 41457]|uniref:Uncharacterized protein n=1 Tax=Edhazardia aedis (strain USNM 41457) TaxID=1003232 RepID=J8ZNW4_EDHAE|nr:hypothetical protein EDEG_03989 [Edhazardia aedis USNM 41457]|eukprot:EJW01383.1 hypothetical protein EDEG_03989 [Edhazardia aedis USNM 41457]